MKPMNPDPTHPYPCQCKTQEEKDSHHANFRRNMRALVSGLTGIPIEMLKKHEHSTEELKDAFSSQLAKP